MNERFERRHGMGVGLACALLVLALTGCNAGAPESKPVGESKPLGESKPVDAQPKPPAAPNDPTVDRPQLDVAALARHTPQQPGLRPVQPRVDSDALPKSDLDACERLCETALRLKCAGDSVAGCENGCRESYALPICRSEMDAFLACAAQSARSDWECDPDTGASVREGVCEREQESVTRCVQALAAAGLPQ